jgi:hypothetical protein
MDAISILSHPGGAEKFKTYSLSSHLNILNVMAIFFYKKVPSNCWWHDIFVSKMYLCYFSHLYLLTILHVLVHRVSLLVFYSRGVVSFDTTVQYLSSFTEANRLISSINLNIGDWSIGFSYISDQSFLPSFLCSHASRTFLFHAISVV